MSAMCYADDDGDNVVNGPADTNLFMFIFLFYNRVLILWILLKSNNYGPTFCLQVLELLEVVQFRSPDIAKYPQYISNLKYDTLVNMILPIIVSLFWQLLEYI